MKTARRIFFTALDDVSQNLSFVESAATLRPRLNKFIRWEGMDRPSIGLVNSFTSSDNNISLLCEGLLIRVSACFEEFLRKIIQEAVTELNAKQLAFESLSEALQKSNRYSAGIALTTIHSGNDVVEFDFDKICNELGTCLPGNTAVLSAEPISYFRGGISKEKLEKRFASVGVKLIWDDVGRSQRVQNAVGETGVRKASNSALSELEELRKNRNRFAHRGVNSETLSIDEVRKSIEFLKALSDELYRQLEVFLNSIN